MQRKASYVVGFAAAVSVVCAVLVSSAAVSLKPLQDANAAAFKQLNVLVAAGLAEPGERLSADEQARRSQDIAARVIELATGNPTEINPDTFDQRRASVDPSTSRPAPPNAARVARVPNHALVYELREEGELAALILPIEGKGLWSTLYGFIALEGDLRTIRGITFYEHRETAGLGGEVDNPRWQALWPGRVAFGEQDEVAITVIKGSAGPPEDNPHEVDGLSGATLTSRGVTDLLRFWLGPDGFGPLLELLRGEAI